MNEQPSESELIGYIDGVLPPDRRAFVERAIAADRELRHQLRRLIKLRSAARRVVRQNTPAVPDELRARIEAMMQVPAETPAAVRRVTPLARKTTSPKPAWIYPLWRPALAAGLAACVGLGIWLAVQRFDLPGISPRNIVQNTGPNGLPSQLVSMVQARHLKCVMMGNNFEDPKFSHVLADVGPEVRRYLGDAVAIPDLTAIGLEFAGVGPCQLDGGRTLHWLFRNPSDPKVNVSVFVQPYTGQVAFDRNTTVVIAGPTSQFPMLVWRDDKFVYYLIGDDFGATSQTAVKLGVSFGI